MGKHETPMILKYLAKVGGTLIAEFPIRRKGERSTRRFIDAVIIPKGPNRCAKQGKVTFVEKISSVYKQRKADSG